MTNWSFNGSLDYLASPTAIRDCATQIADLTRSGDGAFEFERTVSRLIEMQSQDYLAEGHGIGEDYDTA